MKLFSAALIAALAGTFTQTQDKTVGVDKIFSWVTPGMPGCVAAASLDGKVVVNRAYGLADVERNIPLTPDTVFDAGSVRKQFVAAAILILVQEGKLSLGDDVRKYIPLLPDYGHTITIDHLLTHTSGIRDWVPLLNFATGDPDAMSMILRQRGLQFVPGTEWSYSNSGYVLLPEIVARVSGMTFPEFLRKRVLDPAGMKSSHYVDDPATIKDRALAYEKQGSTWRQDMMLANARGGAGALLTTASDLLKWNDALTRARFGKFVTDKIAEPAALANGRKLNYARGLMLETNYGGRLIWHGGSAAAYKAVTGRFVDQGVAIAILCNAGEAADGRTAFAGRIFDLFMADKGLKRPPQPPAPANAEGVDPVAVNAKAGLFINEKTGDPQRINASNGRLGVPPGGLFVALSNDRFRIARPTADFMSMAEVELTFESNDRFVMTTKEGERMAYRRAEPWAPSAEELKSLAGRYESDELRAWFDIMLGESGLVARLNDKTSAPFAPIARDMFQLAQVTLRFRRDDTGKVIGFDFTNPLLRNIRYTKTR